MKSLDADLLKDLPGERMHPGKRFRFACHPGVGCFNLCCRNLNLFLYPYDVLRLKTALGMTAEAFIETHTDVVMRDGQHFPEVLLKMAENGEKTCPYLTKEGCSVYADRPDACRTFPVEHGAVFSPEGRILEEVHLFRPPEFCEGPKEEVEWTLESWAEDQGAGLYNRMTREWGAVRSLFAEDPWGPAGPSGAQAKMAFMAVYNMDAFREFLFGSTFFKRFKVKPDLKSKLKKDDLALLRFGFDWIRFGVWNQKVPTISLRK